jgi:hypothetical protein
MAIDLNDRRTITTTPRAGNPRGNADLWPRIANIVLGVWLFASAFLWTHTDISRTNTWVVGLLAVGFAVWGMWFPAARFLNTALALWLAFSTIIFPTVTATVWNNVLVAVAMFFLSMIPNQGATTPQRRGRYAEV